MCELTTALMVGSLVMGGFSAYQGAQAQKGQAKYQAAVARNNQIYSDQQAERNEALARDAIKRGETEEYRTRLKTKALAGQQKSALASSGVDVAYGSSIDLIGDTFELGELDALTVRNNAERESNNYENQAWASRVQSSNYGAQAGMLDSQANNINPTMAAATTVLDGASSVAGHWNSSPTFLDGSSKTTKLSNGQTVKWNTSRSGWKI